MRWGKISDCTGDFLCEDGMICELYIVQKHLCCKVTTISVLRFFAMSVHYSVAFDSDQSEAVCKAAH
jgi:hypothetical protein